MRVEVAKLPKRSERLGFPDWTLRPQARHLLSLEALTCLPSLMSLLVSAPAHPQRQVEGLFLSEPNPELFLSKGLFPENLPSVFTSRNLWAGFNSLGANYGILRGSVGETATYSASKRGGQRRMFNVPHPAFVRDQALFLQKHWPDISPLIARSSGSVSRPSFFDLGPRHVKITSHAERRPLRGRRPRGRLAWARFGRFPSKNSGSQTSDPILKERRTNFLPIPPQSLLSLCVAPWRPRKEPAPKQQVEAHQAKAASFEAEAWLRNSTNLGPSPDWGLARASSCESLEGRHKRSHMSSLSTNPLSVSHNGSHAAIQWRLRNANRHPRGIRTHFHHRSEGRA